MKRILIVGAGIAGQDVYKEIKRFNNKYKVLGFIDDDKSKHAKNVKGLKVIGGRNEIKRLTKLKKVDEVIIAIPSAHGEHISEIVRLCADSRVSFRIVPRVREIIEGSAHFKQIRKVEVEDLLGRPVIKDDVSFLKNFFKGKNVVVTGAAGSIGSELVRQIAAYRPNNLYLIDWWENGMFEIGQELSRSFGEKRIHYLIANIQNEKKIDNLFKKYKPDFVFHAAAYKHVPLMEDNPEEAIRNNVFGTLSVATAAVNNNVERFVLVSTDKAAKPANVMGMTKLVAESIVKSLNSKGKTKFMSVRFGNVLGSNGSVVPIFRRQIDEGGPITITHPEMTRYFMTIPEAAQLILKAASIGKGGELFVLDMGEPVKIVELAENLIRLSGYTPYKDINIIFTGTRKGEKIHEALFTDKEKMTATKDGKIFVTQSQGIKDMKLEKLFKDFKLLIDNIDHEKIRTRIFKYV